MERDVITCRYIKRFGRQEPTFSYDYSSVEVGDWFIAKGGARVRSARVSLTKNPLAQKMTFSAEPISHLSVKYTRTA